MAAMTKQTFLRDLLDRMSLGEKAGQLNLLTCLLYTSDAADE